MEGSNMNGRRAKKLRRAAAVMCTDVLNIKLGDGYNEYNQANNCVGWQMVMDDDGFPRKDPEGKPLMAVVNTLPGTCTCAWKLRTMYQNLKREYIKRRGGTA
jgi:hypothetical protein